MASAATTLLYYFRRNGHVRVADPARRKKEGSGRYKKGSEVRFVLHSEAEVREVREGLRALGFTPGKVFLKRGRLVVPVYGKRVTDWIRNLRG